MPNHRCKHPTCTEIIPAAGYCAAHSTAEKTTEAARQAFYDQHARNADAKRFYNSAAWKRVRDAVLAENPVCHRCGHFAELVHHKTPLDQCTPEQKLDPANLRGLCVSCHNAEHAGSRGRKFIPAVTGMLDLQEDETFFYDEEAGEKPAAFIEKYCRHYEGTKWAGQPFTLLDWQRRVIHDLFGWKWRATGFRRFREMYLLTAKGAGKTPMLAGLGLYMMLAAGEPAALVVSMASTFEQANYSFGGGKAYIAENEKLQRVTEVCQYEIRGTGKRKHSRWKIVSGQPKGRSGSRPSCIIADEIMEWEPATSQAFTLLKNNLFKRSEPLLLCATNAGADRNSFAWQLHERAMKVLAGKSEEKALLPVIYEAPATLEWTSEEAARAANPSLGQIITFEQMQPALTEAKESPAAEAIYRRLNLSQWVTGTRKWLDVAKWDAVSKPVIDRTALKDAPLYVGLDLSKVDDLCAATFTWVAPDFYTVDAKFWLPRAKAEQYEATHLIPFRQWEGDRHITLLDEPTVSLAARLRIADDIIAMKTAGELKAVCYDPYNADDCIARIEAAGIVCIPVRQGYTLSPGCEELERRIIEKSIAVTANPVLRWNAENVEIIVDGRGNKWPVKPGTNAKTRYSGKRSAKIDGVVSLVTALTEARKHNFPPAPAAKKAWSGGAWIV